MESLKYGSPILCDSEEIKMEDIKFANEITRELYEKLLEYRRKIEAIKNINK